MENIDRVINIIEKLENDGLIKDYAVGGGVATIFYTEVFSTYDIDVFIILPEKTSGLVDISPIYKWFKKRGYRSHREHIIIDDVPVQLLPAYNDLIVEAIEKSSRIKYKSKTIKTFRPEHLVAIMLQTFRPKDRVKIIEFLDNVKLDRKYLGEILKRYNLQGKFADFIKSYGK